MKEICEKIIKENPKLVEDYKAGNKQAINFLIGLAMKEAENYKTIKKNFEELL